MSEKKTLTVWVVFDADGDAESSVGSRDLAIERYDENYGSAPCSIKAVRVTVTLPVSETEAEETAPTVELPADPQVEV